MPAEPLVARLVDAAHAAIAAHADELTELDRAIGDADHGANMLRGLNAIRDARAELAALPLDRGLERMAMLLISKVGGASGPLYGSLLLAMGRAARDPAAAPHALLAAGVAEVKRRGRSGRGEKTMLDVLVPVQEALAAAAAAGLDRAATLARLRGAAAEGLEATRPLVATKGRASYLGPRSAGHLDPGACSSRLLVDAVCGVVEAE